MDFPNPSLPLLVILADAGLGVGWGHVMRCWSLAQIWRQQSGAVVVLAPELPPALHTAAHKLGIEFIAVPAHALLSTEQVAAALAPWSDQPRWLVVDGYGFTAESIGLLACQNQRILLVNDGQWAVDDWSQLPIDLVWGPIFESPAIPLHRATIPQLVGLHFAWIRQEFLLARLQRLANVSLQTDCPLQCLISLGGTVPQAAWRQLLATIEPLVTSQISLHLVLGSQQELATELQAWLDRLPGIHQLTVWPENWIAIMTQTDCAISAAGGTLLELATLGIPTVAIAIADNQRLGGTSLAAAGILDFAGTLPLESTTPITTSVNRLWNDATWRQQLAQSAQMQIDGLGASRTAAWMRFGIFCLRSATAADSHRLWQLRNDPDVRANAFQTDEVGWEIHQTWFDRKLSDKQTRLWIVETIWGEWMGQVRWDLDQDNELAVISFAIVPQARGWGLAARLIQQAVDQLRREFPRLTLHAHVKPHNEPSRKAFLRTGFVPAEGTLLIQSPTQHE